MKIQKPYFRSFGNRGFFSDILVQRLIHCKNTFHFFFFLIYLFSFIVHRYWIRCFSVFSGDICGFFFFGGVLFGSDSCCSLALWWLLVIGFSGFCSNFGFNVFKVSVWDYSSVFCCKLWVEINPCGICLWKLCVCIGYSDYYGLGVFVYI